eukprot:6474151-Amphidinium_carterae.2
MAWHLLRRFCLRIHCIVLGEHGSLPESISTAVAAPIRVPQQGVWSIVCLCHLSECGSYKASRWARARVRDIIAMETGEVEPACVDLLAVQVTRFVVTHTNVPGRMKELKKEMMGLALPRQGTPWLLHAGERRVLRHVLLAGAASQEGRQHQHQHHDRLISLAARRCISWSAARTRTRSVACRNLVRESEAADRGELKFTHTAETVFTHGCVTALPGCPGQSSSRKRRAQGLGS